VFQIEEIKLTPTVHKLLLSSEGSAFLDSSFLDEEDAKYSIYAIDPFIQLKATCNECQCRYGNGNLKIETGDPFNVVEKLVKLSNKKPFEWCEFNSGFAGIFSYEAAGVFEDFNHCVYKTNYPVMLGGIYDRFVVVNHDQNQSFFVSSMLYEREFIKFESLLDQLIILEKKQNHNNASDFKINCISFEDYQKMFNKAQNYILQGDIYQINYSIKYSAKNTLDIMQLFHEIRTKSPAPYGAYLNYFGFQIICNSPELFFKKQNNVIHTKPIKGTIKRGDSPELDLKMKNSLLDSNKDQAELVMITDLERNDLNRICEVNTVKVDTLRAIKAYKYLYHTLSRIKGKLKKNYKLFEIMKHLFPGGSITGAPKIRAMEIIHQLEPSPRGPYTGCIGFVSANNDMVFNIAIRSLYTYEDNIIFHSGGALVADSDAQKEYDECMLKAAAFLSVLEN
jgi:para-aminobenzoate synthetase component I